MDNKNNYKVCEIKKEWKLFFVGVFIGSIFFLFWDFIFKTSSINNLREYNKIEEFKQDSEERLLNYIDGEWISSIGDVIIKINIDKNKDFIVIEVIKDKKSQTNFKISNIDKVNGLFGIVNLNICDVSKSCDRINSIPIQLNKVFGMDRTIAISYDSRLTYCVDTDNICTRAFKRVQ